MVRTFKFFVFFLFSLFVFSFSHKYFHSFTVLRTNSSTGSGEAEVEIIWHDLELSLSKDAGKTITIKSADFSKSLENYFLKNFQVVQPEGQKLNMIFVGYDIHADEINVFLEFPNVSDFSGMQLKNSLLVQEFPEQINQVMLKQGKIKKSWVFNSKSLEKTL